MYSCIGTQHILKSLLTGTNMSESVSQATLATAMDTLGVESNTGITPALGTPIPRTTLSKETVKLLDSVATKLGQTKDQTSNQPNKRRCLEAPEGDIRSSYPKERKTLYLKTKTLHKKKLNLATMPNVNLKVIGYPITPTSHLKLQTSFQE